MGQLLSAVIEPRVIKVFDQLNCYSQPTLRLKFKKKLIVV